MTAASSELTNSAESNIGSALLIYIEWVLAMKRIRRRNKPYISPVRLRIQRQAQRILLLYLSLYFLGFGAGAFCAGMIGKGYPQLFAYITDARAALVGSDIPRGVLKTVGQTAVFCGGFCLCGVSLWGTFASPLLLILAAGLRGMDAGLMLMLFESKAAIAALLVQLIPGIALTVLFACFSKRAAGTSRIIISSAGGENHQTALRQFSLYSALQTSFAIVLSTVEFLLKTCV